MAPPRPHAALAPLIRLLAEVRRRRPGGVTVAGHHHRNYVIALGQPLARLLGEESGAVRAKFRTPLGTGGTGDVLPRLWRRESDVLAALAERLGAAVPRCLADFGGWSVHTYVEGRPLAAEAPAGRPVGEARLAAFADFFARVAGVPADGLPGLPADWPADGDTHGFLRRLAGFAEGVHQRNRPRFGALFDAVGMPRDAVARFLTSVPRLAERPFALLHTDVHRANVVITGRAGAERLVVIDWELALYGDPLHDLATHVVRMDYDAYEQTTMIRFWEDAMHAADRPGTTAGMARDLPVYRDFEYVQSVYPDLMRAALALPAVPVPDDYTRAARRVCRALDRAWKPLALDGAPVDRRTAEEALRAWHRTDRTREPRGR
ncbi:hypothetical protein GCM10010145_00420 [Streptomyces ruber]|uniref:Aminoglycoside phosphotransferase domain-containing protein n=2 Tax=Streptomyces TaxID=1883 RepID=A0A918B8H9_9ACTN|nr:phosphotransferase [Streptomyces ruber]GGQ37309.1 hypothetical protein GCM10010145_00420 [Streptomyces ruber]